MIRYYCDRCGKPLNDVVGNDVEIHMSDLAQFSTSHIDNHIHLCERCFKNFIDEFLYNMKEEPNGKK